MPPDARNSGILSRSVPKFRSCAPQAGVSPDIFREVHARHPAKVTRPPRLGRPLAPLPDARNSGILSRSVPKFRSCAPQAERRLPESSGVTRASQSAPAASSAALDCRMRVTPDPEPIRPERSGVGGAASWRVTRQFRSYARIAAELPRRPLPRAAMRATPESRADPSRSSGVARRKPACHPTVPELRARPRCRPRPRPRPRPDRPAKLRLRPHRDQQRQPDRQHEHDPQDAPELRAAHRDERREQQRREERRPRARSSRRARTPRPRGRPASARARNVRLADCAGPTNRQSTSPPIQNAVAPRSWAKNTASPAMMRPTSDVTITGFGPNRSSKRPGDERADARRRRWPRSRR